MSTALKRRFRTLCMQHMIVTFNSTPELFLSSASEAPTRSAQSLLMGLRYHKSTSLVGCPSRLCGTLSSPLLDHLINVQTDPHRGKASRITKINDEEVNEWLTAFATRNSFGLLEANADWNALMTNPAAEIQQVATAFTGGSTFYPGDSLKFTLQNGTEIKTQWLALANIPFNAPQINSSQDFYDFFVTNEIPADDLDDFDYGGDSSDFSKRENPSANDQDPPKTNSWSNSAYPSKADVHQPDLGTGGYITGYFLRDSAIAVLSIPSFEMTAQAISSFSTTIGLFISESKKAGMKKVIIDLQQNQGGEALLATDAFKQFFPSIEPYGGSRLRAFDSSDALGRTYTSYTSRNNVSQDDEWLNFPWAILDYLDANKNRSFGSWSEFFGPHADNGDFYSTVQRDNLSNSLFDRVATGGHAEDGGTGGIVIYGYGDRSKSTPAPYNTKDILLLTDSICHSACALFVEMMRHEAGVPTVVVGGRPNVGPMQAVAGSRGALVYNVNDLDSAMYSASEIDSAVNKILPSSHLNVEDLQFSISDASINLRDQIRSGPQEYFPLQFAYEAADCRIYWTMDSFNNFTNLWKHAARATWDDPSLCVKDSNIFASRKETDRFGPTSNQKAAWEAGKAAELQWPFVFPAAGNPAGNPAVRPGLYAQGLNATSPSNLTDLSETPIDSGVAYDDLTPIDTSINTHCKQPGKHCRTKSEWCYKIGFCDQGLFQYDTQCKQTCQSSTQCGSSTRLMYCNLEDEICKHSQNTDLSDVKCNQWKRKTTIGGFSTSSTASSTNAQHGTGFCAPVVSKTDLKCRKYDDDHSLTKIATKQSQNFDFGNFYWDSPVSSAKYKEQKAAEAQEEDDDPSDQENASGTEQASAADSKDSIESGQSPAFPAGGSVGQMVNAGFGV